VPPETTVKPITKFIHILLKIFFTTGTMKTTIQERLEIADRGGIGLLNSIEPLFRWALAISCYNQCGLVKILPDHFGFEKSPIPPRKGVIGSFVNSKLSQKKWWVMEHLGILLFPCHHPR